jgi:hypothetical protein
MSLPDVVRRRLMLTNVMSPRVVEMRNTYMGDDWIVRLRGW